jgi:hypothetical protein
MTWFFVRVDWLLGWVGLAGWVGCWGWLGYLIN